MLSGVENNVNILMAALAGAASFVSPCVLPLVPTYLAYLAGASVTELGSSGGADPAARWRVFRNALGFVVGFSVVFVLLGLSASAVGRFLLQHQVLVRRVSGVVIVVLGLHTMGVLKIPALYRERRRGVGSPGSSVLASFLFGLAFSAGWTPCIGPVLASILLVAGASGSLEYGALLLAAYSLGLGVPFLLSAVFFGSLLPLFRKLGRCMKWMQVAAGVLLVILGVLVLFNAFARLAGWLQWG